MSPRERIIDWLEEGNTGTAKDIAEALDISKNDVNNAMRSLRPYVAVIDKRDGPGGMANVFARAGSLPRPKPAPQGPYIGGPIKTQALRSRTPLERAWV